MFCFLQNRFRFWIFIRNTTDIRLCSSHYMVQNLDLPRIDDFAGDCSFKVLSASPSRQLQRQLPSLKWIWILWGGTLQLYKLSCLFDYSNYQTFSLFISVWLMVFYFIQWDIICYYHYLFWCSNSSRFRSRTPFKLPSMSLWHVTIILWALSYFIAQHDITR